MKTNLPEFLYNILIKEYGEELTDKILNGYLEKRKTTVRINTNKITLEEAEQELAKIDVLRENVKWYANALIVSDKEKIEHANIYKERKNIYAKFIFNDTSIVS